MATREISLVFPGAEEFAKEEAKAGVELSDISGKRLALVDDTRPNALVALAGLRDILVKDYASNAFIITVPYSARNEANPPAMFDDIARQADAVVVGVAT